jgi:hypothetical protein
MAHIRRLQLIIALTLVVGGLAVFTAPYVPVVGELSQFAAYKKGSFDITELEQVAAAGSPHRSSAPSALSPSMVRLPSPGSPPLALLHESSRI